MSESFTPMMRQYQKLRKQHPDALLFYRLGDFYELFFEDAKKAAPLLEIALTKRGKHQGVDIPMCGVPAHALDSYLKKLARLGIKVAICEQTGASGSLAPQAKGGSLVERDIVRLVTPGTITETSCLEAGNNNHLTAVFIPSDDDVYLGWVDISTGDFSLASTNLDNLKAELDCIEPAELLVNKSGATRCPDQLGDYLNIVTPLDDSYFNAQRGNTLLCKMLRVISLEGIGQFSKNMLATCSALLHYIEITQKNNLPILNFPKLRKQEAPLVDWATRRSLELTSSISGKKEGSLLGVIDKTLTSGGARQLRALFATPLRTADEINRQLDTVALLSKSAQLELLRSVLKTCPDLERALGRLVLRRGGPRDLALVASALSVAQDLSVILHDTGAEQLQTLAETCRDYGELITDLQTALDDKLPSTASEGNFIRKNFHTVLDTWRGYRDEAQQHLITLQKKYVMRTGINNLKVKHNNLLGYYVEVPNRYAEKMDDMFVHRQSMSNAVRYRTEELTELENKINQAQSEVLAIELDIFQQFLSRLEQQHQKIITTAQTIAQIDLYTSFAVIACQEGYSRPLIDQSKAFRITGGWHPVVGQLMSREKKFIRNDCVLEDGGRLALVTGPNMAGKSTYLRQNAIILFLAHIGCFVPAQTAHIGTVDFLFSRVGATDDLAHGRSTFMVEMLETATILNQATDRSLVILDEVGRGTSTLDGVSIAWATVEYLHEVTRCRGLLATHFQELTLLSQQLANLQNLSMAIREWRKEITFLYEVVPGVSPKSYGLHVAELAGVPKKVLDRAAAVLVTLEKTTQQHRPPALFNLVQQQPERNETSEDI